MFYFDVNLKNYESEFSWDKALLYLEDLFLSNPSYNKLNSLVGFAWYYLIEGPVDSKKYEKDENVIALDIWEKYLRIGVEQYLNVPSFCFISGYSLLLHGFLIEEYKSNYKQFGLDLLKKANKSTDCCLKEIVNLVLEYQKQKKYKSLTVKREVLQQLFPGESLLEKYFKELYCI